MAFMMELADAPVSGNRVVLVAWMMPALLMSLRLPYRSSIASDSRLKVRLEVIFLVGEIVLVVTDAMMLAPWLTLITGTLEPLSKRTPKALPWPMPVTSALIFPGVVMIPRLMKA